MNASQPIWIKDRNYLFYNMAFSRGVNNMFAFVFHGRKKDIWRVNKWWADVHFSMSYPFKMIIQYKWRSTLLLKNLEFYKKRFDSTQINWFLMYKFKWNQETHGCETFRITNLISRETHNFLTWQFLMNSYDMKYKIFRKK